MNSFWRFFFTLCNIFFESYHMDIHPRCLLFFSITVAPIVLPWIVICKTVVQSIIASQISIILLAVAAAVIIIRWWECYSIPATRTTITVCKWTRILITILIRIIVAVIISTRPTSKASIVATISQVIRIILRIHDWTEHKHLDCKQLPGKLFEKWEEKEIELNNLIEINASWIKTIGKSTLKSTLILRFFTL